MKILVTGSNGFLGSQFIELLKNKKIEYFAYNRGQKELVDEFDTVVHFGGLTPNSIINQERNPTDQELYSANVLGTKELLAQLVDKKSLQKIINIGSAAEYGSSQDLITENSPEEPVDMYGKSKLEQKELVRKLSQNNGIKVINLRLFNIIGRDPRKSTSNPDVNLPIIERLEKQFGSNDEVKKIEISNKKNVRDFVDIRDITAGVLLAAETDLKESFENINLSSGRGTSLENLVKLFAEIVNASYELLETKQNFSVSIGDNTKAQELLSWSPKINLEESIRNFLNG